MTIGILATGDEIIHGDTLNTNGHEVAHTLSSASMAVGMQLACSDKEEDIVASLKFLDEHHDTFVLIGGLGPTSDDRTRFALSRFLDIPLIEHERALTHIQTRLNRVQIMAISPNNRQQAYFPKEATLLANPHGTALGCSYQHHGKLFVLLPGPPIECLTMFKEEALPLIIKHQPQSKKRLLKWRLFDVSEGIIAEKLDKVLQHIPCETGYRLERPYLEFKVICTQADIPTVQQIIDPMLADYIIATPEQWASEHLKQLIADLKKPIIIQDEATGGLLQTLIQSPHNYPWLRFQERSHHEALYFHIQGLDNYWRQTPEAKTADIRLTYNDHSEARTFPFYKAWVVNLATEWLCYRIAKILNQFVYTESNANLKIKNKT